MIWTDIQTGVFTCVLKTVLISFHRKTKNLFEGLHVCTLAVSLFCVGPSGAVLALLRGFRNN